MAKRRGEAKKRKDPLWAKLLLVLGALLLVASGGGLIGGKLLLDHYSDEITHTGGLGEAAAEGNTINGPINLLLVGVDERPDNAEMGSRADSIIVAHIPASHDAVYLTSIPRDTRVKIPAFAKTRYTGGTAKINSAFAAGSENGGGRDGGLELLATTVSNLAGGSLKFNGAAIVNFDGFRGLVDAMGGVHMCVDERVTSIHTGWNTKTGAEGVPYNFSNDLPTTLKPNMRPQIYEVGCYDMEPWEALDYVRQRDKLANNDGDYGRQRHQQQFIKAMVKKATSAGVITNPIKVAEMLNRMGAAVSFYNHGIQLTDWIFTLKGIKPDQMVTLKVNNGDYHSETIGGQSYEILDDTAKELLAAIVRDEVGPFVAAHPEMVNNNAEQAAVAPGATPTKSPSVKASTR
ncbi:LCP family protein [Dactylosporangium sp. NPDC005555]|uniref:LCP family protein n=1 Tax=Dactylosporangium sp. NPDC005555 TaxID=3154889 RepID=UPI00339F7E03